MMLLSRKELNLVALAAVVFASITYKIVDQVIAMVPVVGGLVGDVVDGNGCPSTIGFVVHVAVFAAAVKYVLPRM